MKPFGAILLICAALPSYGGLKALPSCDRSGALFVVSEVVQERDVPKTTAIRLRLGDAASAQFVCVLITSASSVIDWQESEVCALGSPSLVVRWRADGTIGTACDPIPEAPTEIEETENAN